MAKLCECGCGQPTPLRTYSAPKRGYIKGQPLRFINGHNARGERNQNWTGDNYTYEGVHLWLRYNYKKTGTCEQCGQRRKTQWANISRENKRDRDDYWELCVPCHHAYDGLSKDFKEKARLRGERTHCERGHAFSEENTVRGVYQGRPFRRCRTCDRITKRLAGSRLTAQAD